ncbi:MAG: hypothetical protein RIG84_15765 [Roseovarius sp.]
MPGEELNGLSDVLSAASPDHEPLQALDLAPWHLESEPKPHAAIDPWRSLLEAHAATFAPRVLDAFDPEEDVVVIALPPEMPEDDLHVRRNTRPGAEGVEIWMGIHLIARLPGIDRLSPEQITVIDG